MGRCHLPPWWYFWGLVNGQPFLSNFELFNDKICFTSKRPWYSNLWKQICEWSGVRFWPPGPVRFSVSSVGQPLSYINFKNRFSYIKLKNQAKKHLWKTLELFSFFLLVTSFIKLYQRQGGRTWQPFFGGKNGHENFRQARIYNFCSKCVVFARNRKFAKLTQWNMQYIPCNSALLAQETLFLTQKGTFFCPKVSKKCVNRDKSYFATK